MDHGLEKMVFGHPLTQTCWICQVRDAPRAEHMKTAEFPAFRMFCIEQ